jgi:hypothetical protein
VFKWEALGVCQHDPLMVGNRWNIRSLKPLLLCLPTYNSSNNNSNNNSYNISNNNISNSKAA